MTAPDDDAAFGLQPIGVQHPKVKQVLALQRNTVPNGQQLFVAEGLWAHNVVLAANAPVHAFLYCPEAGYSDEARLRARQVADRATQSYRVSEKTFARMSERDRPDGLLSITQLPYWTPENVPVAPDGLVLVADGLEIPGNLGTLVRTLDACGADCLVLTNRRTRLTHPKVFRGSHGTTLNVPTVEFDEPAEAIAWLKDLQCNVYLADTDDAVAYRGADYSGRTAIVVGSERFGISAQFYRHDFTRVRVPMLGRGDSLNVAVS
ncbi:MAG: RNA methyltransferase, partial [Geodermatophilaceae bacterium]|nr:RNA methyltransferase [Geodermatophilaceae bacterium]